jgi:hypothetical protein
VAGARELVHGVGEQLHEQLHLRRLLLIDQRRKDVPGQPDLQCVESVRLSRCSEAPQRSWLGPASRSNPHFPRTGLSVCVGIVPTETPAKFVTRFPKRNPALQGVCSWDNLSAAHATAIMSS